MGLRNPRLHAPPFIVASVRYVRSVWRIYQRNSLSMTDIKFNEILLQFVRDAILARKCVDEKALEAMLKDRLAEQKEAFNVKP